LNLSLTSAFCFILSLSLYLRSKLRCLLISFISAKEAKESDSRSYDFELEAKRSRKILRPYCTGKRLEVLLCREKVEVPLYRERL
jgi:hypothetical protein